jgi:hypothetical protein
MGPAVVRVRVALWLAALLVTALPGNAHTNGAVVDQDYVSALATAGRFLQAWQAQDQENVILMLSDHLRQRTEESAVEQFVTAPGGARPAYELGRGKKLAPGRYQFPVTLFAGAHSHGRWIQPRSSSMVVVKSGKDEWAVDKLP